MPLMGHGIQSDRNIGVVKGTHLGFSQKAAAVDEAEPIDRTGIFRCLRREQGNKGIFLMTGSAAL